MPKKTMSLRERWGFDVKEWVGLPLPLLEVCRERKLPGGQFYVLVAVLTAWRPALGTSFACSLTEITERVPLSRSQVGDILFALAERGLLHVFSEPGKTRRIDVAPLLAAARAVSGQPDGAVRPAGRLLSGGPDTCAGQPDSGVRSTGQNCPVGEPAREHPEFRSRNQNPRGARGGASASPSESNGNGNGTAIPAVDRSLLELMWRKRERMLAADRAQCEQLVASLKQGDVSPAAITAFVDRMKVFFLDDVNKVLRNETMLSNSRKAASA